MVLYYNLIMNKKYGTISTLLLALLVAPAIVSHAEENKPEVEQKDPNFLKSKEDGWFWYKDPKDEAPKPVVKAPEPAPVEPKKEEKKVEAPKEEIKPFSVEWLRKNMKVLLDRAIDDPTNENVTAYFYAQRVAMDKAQNYAEMARTVVASDPFLDENNRVPIASFATAQMGRNMNRAKEDALKYLSTVGGLFVFFSSSCEFCRPQVNTVKEVAKKYGMTVKFVSMDGKGLPGLLADNEWVKDSGQAKRLNVKLTPTTVFATPPNNYSVISQGLMAQDGLSDRLLLAAQSNNLLPKEILAGIEKYQRGVLKPDDMKDGAGDDPKVWIEKLKARLDGRY